MKYAKIIERLSKIRILILPYVTERFHRPLKSYSKPRKLVCLLNVFFENLNK